MCKVTLCKVPQPRKMEREEQRGRIIHDCRNPLSVHWDIMQNRTDCLSLRVMMNYDIWAQDATCSANRHGDGGMILRRFSLDSWLFFTGPSSTNLGLELLHYYLQPYHLVP